MSQRKNLSAQKNPGIHSLLGHAIPTTFTYQNQVYLGGGSYGQVYKIQLQNTSLSQLTYNGKSIEWVFKKSKYIFKEESEIQSRFYLTCKPVKDNNGYYYTVSEFLPGIDLDAYRGKDFSERMIILCQLASQVSDFHHFTWKGAPFVHGDLKSGNIKVDINKTTKEVNTYIYDFGFSSTHQTGDYSKLFQFRFVDPHELNDSYFPKEALSGKYGYKTDVYMFGKVMLTLLNPMPKHLISIKKTLQTFLQSVRSDDYDKRPTSDEVLKFSLLVNRLHLLKEKKLADKALENALSAQLAVLAMGYWELPMNDNQLWNEFYFEANPKICEIICLLNDKALLRRNSLAFLTADPHVPFAIKHLDEMGFLNESTLTMLQHRPELAEQLQSTSHSTALSLLIQNCSASLDQKQLENLFVTYKTDPLVIGQLMKAETKRLKLPVVYQGLDIMIQNGQNIPIYMLPQLSGSLTEKQAIAKKIINHRLAQCESREEVTKLLEALKSIDFLYQRQGFFKFFSIHNHKYEGKKVSGTWLEIAKLHEERIKALEVQEQQPAPSQGCSLA